MKMFLLGLGVGAGLGVMLAPRRGRLAGNIAGGRPGAGTHSAFSPVRERQEHPGSRRDPEERPVDQQDKAEVREKMLDKTLADSFPTSDPPSSIPDPSEDDSLTA